MRFGFFGSREVRQPSSEELENSSKEKNIREDLDKIAAEFDSLQRKKKEIMIYLKSRREMTNDMNPSALEMVGDQARLLREQFLNKQIQFLTVLFEKRTIAAASGGDVKKVNQEILKIKPNVIERLQKRVATGREIKEQPEGFEPQDYIPGNSSPAKERDRQLAADEQLLQALTSI